jgi:cobalt-zinc-cadmium efflux system outer membrane protein
MSWQPYELPSPDEIPSAPPQAEEIPHPSLPALALQEVLTSVERHFPLLLAALQEQGITSGQLLAAQGAFDLYLRAREFGQLGTFDSHRFQLGFEQNLAWNGLSYFAGYRQSEGSFPVYYGDRKTADGGEFRAGLLIPLLANRAIDRRRATLQQAAIGRAMATPVIAAQRIDFLRAAARAYWTWVAAGRRYQITLEVLRIAQERDQQLAELVQGGAVAEFERIDNQRVIVERQSRLIVAERAWQQATIALSLYLRGPDGAPYLAPASRLPQQLPDPPPVENLRQANEIDVAFRLRPELQRLRLQRARLAVEFQLARNQLLPGVNLGLEAAQDVGASSATKDASSISGTQLDQNTYVASVQLDVPLQRRDARGRMLAAQAAMNQLVQQERFQQDRIVAEIQDAVSALARYYELLDKARENAAVARRVESGERERFMRGQGSIVILNLRELVAAEALLAEVDALAEYYRSLADYRAALGLDAQPDNAQDAANTDVSVPGP